MQPWVVDANVSYGFAAARLSGKSESDWPCACYALKFTSGAAKGKTFVAQVENWLRAQGWMRGWHFLSGAPAEPQQVLSGWLCRSSPGTRLR
ncbi:hypothetical protein [Cystobacter fuscus]|uniref:hypothetical protein n=1 Tax=Cystobacter fuscus TaxID=43 RepID=UPI003B28C166